MAERIPVPAALLSLLSFLVFVLIFAVYFFMPAPPVPAVGFIDAITRLILPFAELRGTEFYGYEIYVFVFMFIAMFGMAGGLSAFAMGIRIRLESGKFGLAFTIGIPGTLLSAAAFSSVILWYDVFYELVS